MTEFKPLDLDLEDIPRRRSKPYTTIAKTTVKAATVKVTKVRGVIKAVVEIPPK